jgi:hypothetical protein
VPGGQAGWTAQPFRAQGGVVEGGEFVAGPLGVDAAVAHGDDPVGDAA